MIADTVKRGLTALGVVGIVAAGYGVLGVMLVRANDRARTAEAAAKEAKAAAERAADEQRLAEQQIGVAKRVGAEELQKRLDAEAQRDAADRNAAGWRAELARVKAAAGKSSHPVFTGSGESGELPASGGSGAAVHGGGAPGTAAGGLLTDTAATPFAGRFKLRVEGVATKTGALAIATWAQAWQTKPVARLLFEGPVPLDVAYTPDAPPPQPDHAGYGAFVGFAFDRDGRVTYGLGPAAALAGWDVGPLRLRLSGGIAVWPNVIGGVSLLAGKR